MKNILDYTETTIQPRFKERFGNVCVGLIQLIGVSVFGYFFLGRAFVWFTYNIMISDVFFIKVLAVLIVIIVGGFILGFLTNFLWQAFGRDKITITNAAIIIKRSCILNFEKRIDFADIENMEFFVQNIRLDFSEGVRCFPHNFGKIKVNLKDSSPVAFGYDISKEDFIIISRELNEYT